MPPAAAGRAAAAVVKLGKRRERRDAVRIVAAEGDEAAVPLLDAVDKVRELVEAVARTAKAPTAAAARWRVDAAALVADTAAAAADAKAPGPAAAAAAAMVVVVAVSVVVVVGAAQRAVEAAPFVGHVERATQHRIQPAATAAAAAAIRAAAIPAAEDGRGGLRGERHLIQELLLREAFELQLLVGVRRERGVLPKLLEHLLVQRLREQPVRGLLLHHLDLRLLGQAAERLRGDVGRGADAAAAVQPDAADAARRHPAADAALAVAAAALEPAAAAAAAAAAHDARLQLRVQTRLELGIYDAAARPPPPPPCPSSSSSSAAAAAAEMVAFVEQFGRLLDREFGGAKQAGEAREGVDMRACGARLRCEEWGAAPAAGRAAAAPLRRC